MAEFVRSFNVRVVPSDQRGSVASEPRVHVDEFERAVRCRFRNVGAMKARASLSPRERRELEANERR
jgi:hypothetical protein